MTNWGARGQTASSSRARVPVHAAAALVALLLLTGPGYSQDSGAGAGDPAPSGGEWSASVDARYRFVKDIGGNREVYRSVVNLGEGPRLFGGDFRYTNPLGKWADEVSARADNWGGDPYNTAQFNIKLRDVYELRLNYRNVAYFNNLPSFANPLLSEGVMLSQRALDITRRQLDTELTIKPNSTVSPFFAFYSAEGFGRGVTTFITNGNEFPVSTDLDDDLTSFRGGVKLNFEKYHFTLEQGATSFSDDQRIVQSEAGNPGNRNGTFAGRNIILDGLRQRYRAEGTGPFSRGVVQGRPWKVLHFSGQFLYSQPEIDVTQDLDAGGSFVNRLLSPFTGQIEQNLADANRPHSAGSWNNEFRLHPRLRIVQSWMTDRFHVASGSTLVQTLNTSPETLLENIAVNRLNFNYNQHQVDAIFDVNRRVSVRGGHRYVWGDALVPPASLRLTPEPQNQGEIRRSVALAGARVRITDKLTVNGDYEGSPGDRTFFRTGLMDYKKGKVRARYKITPSWSLQGSFAILDNRNPQSDINLDFQSRQTSLSLFWTPHSGRRFTFLADYTRATLRSDIERLELPFFGTELSSYRDNGHHGSAFVDVLLAADARLTVGGALSVNSGSRPVEYYQPQAMVVVPAVQRLSFVAEWRWYGFSEAFFRNEDFRTHALSTGLQFGW